MLCVGITSSVVCEVFRDQQRPLLSLHKGYSFFFLIIHVGGRCEDVMLEEAVRAVEYKGVLFVALNDHNIAVTGCWDLC